MANERPLACGATDCSGRGKDGSIAGVLREIGARGGDGVVGDNAAEIRSRACENLRFLGIELDEQANVSCKPDADIATRGAAARVL